MLISFPAGGGEGLSRRVTLVQALKHKNTPTVERAFAMGKEASLISGWQCISFSVKKSSPFFSLGERLYSEGVLPYLLLFPVHKEGGTKCCGKG